MSAIPDPQRLQQIHERLRAVPRGGTGNADDEAYLLALVDALQQQVARLEAQAREVSVALSDAGVGPCTILQGVRALEQRSSRVDE
jgi:hypothetical protein